MKNSVDKLRKEMIELSNEKYRELNIESTFKEMLGEYNKLKLLRKSEQKGARKNIVMLGLRIHKLGGVDGATLALTEMLIKEMKDEGID